jgi:hypothetical protein
MPRLLGSAQWPQFSLHRFSFQAAKVAANANLAMSITATDAASGSLGITSAVLPFAGSIVRVAWNWSGAITGGNFTLTPQLGGSAITAARLILTASNAQNGLISADAQEVGARFNAPNPSAVLLGVNLVTNAGFLPAASIDLSVDVYVLFEAVQL